MSDDIAKSAIDIATNCARRNDTKEFHLLFHGGGEALTVWPLLKTTTEYTKNVWEGPTKFSIVTNGTLITSKYAAWFRKYDFRFTISLDGPEDIQNVQRPMISGKGSFEACYNGVKILRSEGVRCGIRATITRENVHRMDELVQIAADLDCGLKVEPVDPKGRGEESVSSLHPIDFITSFQHANVLAKKLGVRLISTYSPNLEPRSRYCAADGEMFLVLPTGEVSCCSRVTRSKDDLSDIFIIGKIRGNQLDVNTQMVERLRKLHVQEFSQCADCFAKWHCAGGCHNTRLSSDSGNMSKGHCDLVRWFLWTELLQQANL